MDHVRGRFIEPPSNASATTRNKWTKGEVEARKIIRDSIHKFLVAYFSELNTERLNSNFLGVQAYLNSGVYLF